MWPHYRGVGQCLRCWRTISDPRVPWTGRSPCAHSKGGQRTCRTQKASLNFLFIGVNQTDAAPRVDEQTGGRGGFKKRSDNLLQKAAAGRSPTCAARPDLPPWRVQTTGEYKVARKRKSTPAKRKSAPAKRKSAPARARASARRSRAEKPAPEAEAYRHPEATSLARPEAGQQARFRKRKPKVTYRYDSSLSPSMEWDGQNAAREHGEWLVGCIAEASKLANTTPPFTFSEPRQFISKDGRIVAEVRNLADATDQLRKLCGPLLNWAGKAERLSFDAPTLPLFVHERLSTQAIIETLTGHRKDAAQANMFDLFGDPQRPLADAITKAYEHQDKWVNRLILGDSLVVMNSLLPSCPRRTDLPRRSCLRFLSGASVRPQTSARDVAWRGTVFEDLGDYPGRSRRVSEHLSAARLPDVRVRSAAARTGRPQHGGDRH